MATTKPPRPRASPLKTGYLTLYNALSALIWLAILSTVLSTIFLHAGTNANVWAALNAPALYAESLAGLEVLHAILGVVRASPATTALQVAGRNTVLWAIARNYPAVAARGSGWAYSVMLGAWAAAEVVRYGYFACEMATGWAPRWLVWLRYNMFMVLYPPGILSEAWLVYSVIEPSKERNPIYQYLLWFGLAIYVPATYILFSHMFVQKRKIAKRQSTVGQSKQK